GQPEQFVGVVRYAFHPGLGVLAQTSDANGVRTWYQYDGFGRHREITHGYGSQGPLLKNHTHFDDTWQDGLLAGTSRRRTPRSRRCPFSPRRSPSWTPSGDRCSPSRRDSTDSW